MTTWTMDQVRGVGRLRAELEVDRELVDRYGDPVLREAEGEMARVLAHMAHPFGVDLSLDDRSHYEIEWTDGDQPWHVRGRMRWHPSTRAVELRGGHVDGTLLDVAKVGEPVRVARPIAAAPLYVDEDAFPTTTPVLADTYELAGWREDGGVWVYEAAERKPDRRA